MATDLDADFPRQLVDLLLHLRQDLTGEIVFSLPQLHDYFMQHYGEENPLSLKYFLKLLYRFQINAALQSHGLMVDLKQSDGKISSNLYILKDIDLAEMG